MNVCAVLLMTLIAPAFGADADDHVEIDALVERLRQSSERVDAVSPAVDDVHDADAADDTTGDDVLASALAEAGRRDQSARDAQDAVHAESLDATTATAGDVGAGGTLWVFWALDAPGSQVIAERLNALADSHSEVRIRDCHVMPARAWQVELKRLHDAKDALERNDPAIADDLEIRQKTDLRNALMWSWRGFNAMAQERRAGVGYLLFENVSSMRDLGVKTVPSFRYVSAQGAVHALEGLAETTDLGLWIDRCLAWEREHLAQARHDLLGESE